MAFIICAQLSHSRWRPLFLSYSLINLRLISFNFLFGFNCPQNNKDVTLAKNLPEEPPVIDQSEKCHKINERK